MHHTEVALHKRTCGTCLHYIPKGSACIVYGTKKMFFRGKNLCKDCAVGLLLEIAELDEGYKRSKAGGNN